MSRSSILLVDDNIDFLTSLSKLLGYFGYVVAGAANSEAAMNYVANSRSRFDLIITDLAMPHIDGLAFIAAAKKAFPDVPVIVVTGHADQRSADAASNLGTFAYLTKPLNTQELVSTIERAVRSSAKVSSQRSRSAPDAPSAESLPAAAA